MNFKSSFRAGMKQILSIVACICLLLSTSCKKEPEVKAVPETSTMTDVEGNVYKTVKIGAQWWMAEDLKVKKYKNGVDIKAVTDNNAKTWSVLTKGAYCVYNQSDVAKGKLYNWYAVKDSNNIAPEGWHIPSDEEWKTLEQHLGMSSAEAAKVNWRGSNQGEKLKMEGQSSWTTFGDLWATNESGFSALAGGCRMQDGRWSTPTGLSFTGFWWTESVHDEAAWYRHLDYKSKGVFRFYGPKNYAFSIRCIKNQ